MPYPNQAVERGCVEIALHWSSVREIMKLRMTCLVDKENVRKPPTKSPILENTADPREAKSDHNDPISAYRSLSYFAFILHPPLTSMRRPIYSSQQDGAFALVRFP